ncbi:hypothetical protein [Streptomyces sp. NPDC048577]|uniref:hypothetical protein n=1 Tax=Streptomyces sp. NPDC048577 TaxID=3157209 RepID=UPI003417895F
MSRRTGRSPKPGAERAGGAGPVRRVLRRHLVLTVSAVVALVSVVVVGAAEYTARAVIRHRITEAAPALGDDVVIGTGGDWAAWHLARRRIPRLLVSSDDAVIGPLPRVRVRVRLDGVRLGERATVTATHARVSVPTESLAAAIRTVVPSVAVHEVTTDPARGTVLAAVGPGGAGQLTLRPVLADGRVTLAVDGLRVFGRSVPTDRLVTDGAGLGSRAGTPRTYPLGLRATSARVRSEGLEVTLVGGRSALDGA